MPEIEIEKLREWIKKTGHPLEIEISSKLEEKKWQFVRNSDAYYDRATKKLRVIDIYAYNKALATEQLEVQTDLVIECKKDYRFTWLFYTRPYNYRLEDVRGQYIDEVQLATKNMEDITIIEKVMNPMQLHYSKHKKVAVTRDSLAPKQDYKTKRKEEQEHREFEARDDQIFKAQNQLTKYIAWSNEQLLKEHKEGKPYWIEVYFPCIVLDGDMYEVEIRENVEPILTKTDHVILRTQGRFPEAIYEKCLLIDVVTKEYFTRYEGMIRQDIESVRATITHDIDQISNRIGGIVNRKLYLEGRQVTW